MTNPVSHDDFLTLINNFIDNHEDIDTIFVASDDYSLKQAIKYNYKDKRVIDTGEAVFWKDLEKPNTFAKADHAVLDCLLLSRCKYLIKNQSALSGFAKVFNPKIEAYRIAASKLLSYIPYSSIAARRLFAEIPYFPDAYIPPLESEDPNCKVILKRLLDKDWTQNKKALQKFGKPFVTMERFSLQWKIWAAYQRVRRAF